MAAATKEAVAASLSSASRTLRHVCKEQKQHSSSEKNQGEARSSSSSNGSVAALALLPKQLLLLDEDDAKSPYSIWPIRQAFSSFYSSSQLTENDIILSIFQTHTSDEVTYFRCRFIDRKGMERKCS